MEKREVDDECDEVGEGFEEEVGMDGVTAEVKIERKNGCELRREDDGEL
jgi:hypothetical protein